MNYGSKCYLLVKRSHDDFIVCSKKLELYVLCLNMAMFWHVAAHRTKVLCPIRETCAMTSICLIDVRSYGNVCLHDVLN